MARAKHRTAGIRPGCRRIPARSGSLKAKVRGGNRADPAASAVAID